MRDSIVQGILAGFLFLVMSYFYSKIKNNKKGQGKSIHIKSSEEQTIRKLINTLNLIRKVVNENSYEYGDNREEYLGSLPQNFDTVLQYIINEKININEYGKIYNLKDYIGVIAVELYNLAKESKGEKPLPVNDYFEVKKLNEEYLISNKAEKTIFEIREAIYSSLKEYDYTFHQSLNENKVFESCQKIISAVKERL